MTRQTFKTTDVLKLEVEQTPTGLVNLIQNPTGELGGGWGWVTPVGNSKVRGADVGGFRYLQFAPTSPTAANWFYSDDFAIAAGQYAAARWDQAGSLWLRARFEWLNSAGAVISSSVQGGYTSGGLTTAPTAQSYAAAQAPASTVKARLRYDVYQNNTGSNPVLGGHAYIRQVTVAKAATSAALSGLGYLDPATYTNVLGATHSIKVTRDELNLGILTAEILDATIDPSQTTLIRPGKRVRLMALDSATSAWEPIFTGKVTRGETKYDPKRTDAKRARITLTAVDAVSALAQVPQPSGVATIAELPYLLEGGGLPWEVNGSGNQIGSATIITTNENASMLDQIAITRDSVLGYAWVDRRGVVQIWDRTSIGSTVVATLNESKYSGVEIDYDTDRCINTVNVKLRRINAATGKTVEVPYGPFVDQASIDQWGPRKADFTIQGITDSAAAAAAYAAPILTANATPVVRVNKVQLPIRDAVDVVAGKALLDLYDLVTVANTNAAISQNMRITALEHTIEDGKWMLDLNFTVTGSVAAPQQVAPAPVGVDPVTTSWQVAATGSVTPTNTTNIAVSGLSIAVTSPAASAVFMVEIDADVSTNIGGTVNLIELLVDGLAQTAQLITHLSANALRVAGHKKWRITGLSAGSHTFTAQTRNTAAGTSATVNLTHTLMTAQLLT